MEFHQIFAIFIFLSIIYSWFYKQELIRKAYGIVDTDKLERKNLLDEAFLIYLLISLILAGTISFSKEISFFIFSNFGFDFSSEKIAIFLFSFFFILNFVVRSFISKKEINNKMVHAIPYSTYGLLPKVKNLGTLEGAFLESQKMDFLRFTLRVDDYTIQKIDFQKDGILLKLKYLQKLFKADRFNENDFIIFDKVEKEISSRNNFEFKISQTLEEKVIQIIKAIQSDSKYAFAFGQIIQYSDSSIVDDILVFLQDIQENRYCSSSLPYLLHFKEHIK